MMGSIDISEKAVTLVGLQETIGDCQYILDAVNTSDENSRNLIDVVKDKLTAIEFELSELQKRE